MSALLPGLMHPGRRKGDILSITPSPPPSASARTAASSVGNSQSSPLCYKQPCALRLLAQAWNSCGCLALEASFSHSIPILKRKRPARCARWGSNPCLVAKYISSFQALRGSFVERLPLNSYGGVRRGLVLLCANLTYCIATLLCGVL